jgi:hypothetical protein
MVRPRSEEGDAYGAGSGEAEADRAARSVALLGGRGDRSLGFPEGATKAALLDLLRRRRSPIPAFLRYRGDFFAYLTTGILARARECGGSGRASSFRRRLRAAREPMTSGIANLRCLRSDRGALTWYGPASTSIGTTSRRGSRRLLPLVPSWMENDGLTRRGFDRRGPGGRRRSALRGSRHPLDSGALRAAPPLRLDGDPILEARRPRPRTTRSRDPRSSTSDAPEGRLGEVERPMPPIETATGREASGLIRPSPPPSRPLPGSLSDRVPNPAGVLLAEPGRGYRSSLRHVLSIAFRSSDYGALSSRTDRVRRRGLPDRWIAVNAHTWRAAAAVFARLRAFRPTSRWRFKIVRHRSGNRSTRAEVGSFHLPSSATLTTRGARAAKRPRRSARSAHCL